MEQTTKEQKEQLLYLKQTLGKAIDESISIYIDEHYNFVNENFDDSDDEIKNVIPRKKNFSRNRILNFETMIRLMLTMDGGSIQKELLKANLDVSASAFVQQRKKIPYTVFENVLEQFNLMCEDTEKFHGYRVLAVDGTVVNMARNPKSSSYVKHAGTPKGYNQLHLTPLYDVLNKTFLHAVIHDQPTQDEIGALLWIKEWYYFRGNEKILIVGDRGFESYNVFAHILEQPNMDFLIRIKDGYSAMREVQKLPMTVLDKKISFTLTTTQTNADKANGYVYIPMRKAGKSYINRPNLQHWDFGSPYPMSFRVVRIKIDGKYETLATSLPESISADEIKNLYHERWGIETAFRTLKYSLGLVNLHGKSDEFVRQEIFASMIVSNFCNRIMNNIIIPNMQKKKYLHKLNMELAVPLCKEFLRSKKDKNEIRRIIETLQRYTVPVRDNRQDERDIKAKTFSGFYYRISA